MSEVVEWPERLMEIYEMPIGIGVPLKITIRGQIVGQRFENICWYETDGAAFLTADAVGVGEAYWNNIKALWRAAMIETTNLTTTSIVVSEQGATGAFGEFSVPPAEQQGTRNGVGTLGFLPTFNAAGIRQTVATRTTRPGQKRIVGGTELDNNDGRWSIEYMDLIEALAVIFAEPRVLGAPVATGVLYPIVTRLSPTGDEVLASQRVTGFVVNPNVTSQVSRKPGRGI